MRRFSGREVLALSGNLPRYRRLLRSGRNGQNGRNGRNGRFGRIWLNCCAMEAMEEKSEQKIKSSENDLGNEVRK